MIVKKDKRMTYLVTRSKDLCIEDGTRWFIIGFLSEQCLCFPVNYGTSIEFDSD